MKMPVHNFDEHFAEFTSEWMKEHKNEYRNFDEMEEDLPRIYMAFLNTRAPWLGSVTPGSYFTQFEDPKVLVDWRTQYCEERVPVPDLLLEQITTVGRPCEKRLLELLPGEIPLLPCGYDNAAFEAFAPAMADAPEGGERCLACFGLRLDYTAARAKEHGFEYFTTTLSVSPHKNADNVNRIGEEAGKKHGVKYLFADFKKKNGYLRSLELSKEYGLYRQDYCGCRYSMNHDQAD